MSQEITVGRRAFLKNVGAAGAGLAVGLDGAPALLGAASPNETIGVACIGVGTQGHRLLRLAQAVPNTEIRLICDLYTGNVARAQKLCTNPLAPATGRDKGMKSYDEQQRNQSACLVHKDC